MEEPGSSESTELQDNSAYFFTNNPIYKNINLLDYNVPGPGFDFRWNKLLKQWEPTTKEVEDTLTHQILSGVRSDLAQIEIDVEIDSDAEAHRLLSGTNLLLSGVRQDLKAIEIDVEIDSDIETHRLLSGVIDLLQLQDQETHRLLNGISGEVYTRGEENNLILESISGEINSLANSNYTELNKILSNIDYHGKQNQSLLQDVTGLINLYGQEQSNLSSGTNELLEGVREDLSSIHIDVEVDSDPQTHSLLSGVIETNDRLISNTNELLEGVREDLSSIHIDVEVDSDPQTHSLLSGLIDSLDAYGDENELLTTDTNNILEEILVKFPNSGLETLTELPDMQESGVKLLQEIKNKLFLKSKTRTVTQKIEEDFILMEDIPDDLRYGQPSDICFGTNTELRNELFTTYFPNARRIYSEPETGHPDYFLHAEQTDPNRCAQSYSTFHTDAELSLRLENDSASKLNSYSLKDYEHLHSEGVLEYITIYNESNYPILFHCGETNDNIDKNDDMLSLFPESAVKISFDEADKVFIKRPYTISGYNVKYAITYKKPE
jgi:hypothetical protein